MNTPPKTKHPAFNESPTPISMKTPPKTNHPAEHVFFLQAS